MSDNNLWQQTADAFAAPALERDTTADLVIIGGGFSGCAAALRAAEDGHSAVVLEAQTIGHGGSGRNVGLVNAGLWLAPEEIEARLGKQQADSLNALLAQAPELVFSLIEKHRISCEATRAGTLHCAHSASGLKVLTERHRQMRERGAPVSLLDAAETAARTGSDIFHGALFDPRAGTIQPLAYCQGLGRAAQSAGAKLYERSAALSITRDGSDWLVKTPLAKVRAGALLLATNAYHVAADGLRQPASVPVCYFQMATAPVKQNLGGSILAGGEGCWDTATVMSSFRRDAAGRVIVGGIGALDHSGHGVHRRWALRKLAALFPQLAGHALQHAWFGKIAMTSDHIPKIQRLGENAFSVFGYSGRGIGPGTTFGRALASALARGDDSGLPLEPIDDYAESMIPLKRVFYEVGASAFHFVDAR